MIKTLLLLLKAGKLGKVMLSGGTMLLSVIAYSWVFGWWYAVGFVVGVVEWARRWVVGLGLRDLAARGEAMGDAAVEGGGADRRPASPRRTSSPGPCSPPG